MRSLEETLSALMQRALSPSSVESIPLGEALGRILAEPVLAPMDVPGFDNAQMDGFAVRTEEIAPGQAMPVSQRIAAGHPGGPLARGSAARIFTGAPIPDGANAVVMQEQALQEPDGQSVRFSIVPERGQHIRPRGGDLQVGVEVCPKGRRLRPSDLGLLASIGIAQVRVYRPLRLCVFSSGDELVQPGIALSPGQIYDSNRPMMLAMARSLGALVTDLGVLPDRAEVTREALAQAGAEQDVVLTCGGVSVGEEDHIKAAVRAVGELDLWQVAIKPGKPFAFGRVGSAAFLGLPGNPVSAWVTFVLLVQPFLLRSSGADEVTAPRSRAIARFDWPRPDAREEFLRGWLDEEGRVGIHPKQNSQLLTSVTQSNCLVRVPAGTVVRAGDSVELIPFSALRI